MAFNDKFHAPCPVTDTRVNYYLSSKDGKEALKTTTFFLNYSLPLTFGELISWTNGSQEKDKDEVEEKKEEKLD